MSRAGRKPCSSRASISFFSFLTTEANDVGGAIHPRAMPVILTTEAVTAPAEDAVKLQRPFADVALEILATGERKDEAA